MLLFEAASNNAGINMWPGSATLTFFDVQGGQTHICFEVSLKTGNYSCHHMEIDMPLKSIENGLCLFMSKCNSEAQGYSIELLSSMAELNSKGKGQNVSCN